MLQAQMPEPILPVPGLPTDPVPGGSDIPLEIPPDEGPEPPPLPSQMRGRAGAAARA